jgi:cyclopropane fatty-acyl-phospholipid synthase-like methyltransferase
MNIDEVKKYFQEKVKLFGATAEGMDWKNKETQYLRFDIISKYIDFNTNSSVLDVGCGASEFLNYCNINKFNCSYTGIDIVQEMVDESNKMHNKKVAKLASIQDLNKDEIFDYVIASGTFNAKINNEVDQWGHFFYNSIEKMYEHSTKGVVFNCMTEFVDYEYDRLYYPKLSELGSFITKNLSRKFIIDHSYPLYELTIFIDKR